MARHHLSLYLKIYSNFIANIKTTVFAVLILSQIVLEINQHHVYAVSLSSSPPSSTAKADKFGAYIERQPESTIAPLYDEVLFECGLNLVSDHIEWRFRPQNLRSSSASSYADYIYLNKVRLFYDLLLFKFSVFNSFYEPRLAYHVPFADAFFLFRFLFLFIGPL